MPVASPPALPLNQTRGHIINIVGWVGAIIATSFVALRIYCRRWITHSMGWDDAIIALAAILNIITVALGSVSVAYGNGRHIYYLSHENLVNALYYSVIARPIGIAAYCLPKLSVVILLIGLMGPEKRKRSVWFLYSVIAILFATSALASILLFAQCDPPNHLWHPFSAAKCWPDYVLDNTTYVAGSWSAFTDLVLAVFPITLLWNLKMKRSRKLSIIVIMGFGFFAMVAAVIKTTQLPQNHAQDASWGVFWLFISTYVETDLVIIAACIPPLRRFVLKMLGRDTENSAGQGGYLTKSSALGGYRAFDGLPQHISLGKLHSNS